MAEKVCRCERQHANHLNRDGSDTCGLPLDHFCTTELCADCCTASDLEDLEAEGG